MAKPRRDPQVLFNAAVGAFQAGDLARAEREARKLTKMFPAEADCWNLRAQIALKGERPSDAIRFFKMAVKARPDDAALWNNLGNVLQQNGEWEPAVDAYRQSLRFRPGDRDTMSNFGNALIAAGQLADAEDVYRSMLARDAADTSALVNLSYVLTLRREPDAVVELIEKTMQGGELAPAVCNNFATNLAELGRLDDSADVLAKGLARAPDDPNLRFKNSVVQMLRGDWHAGWGDFDARWVATDMTPRPFGQAVWRNQNLEGKTILVWGEQGIGDEVMLASMVPDLLARAGKVIVECDPRLSACFRRSFEGAVVVDRTNPPAAELMSHAIDFQIAAGDLGRWLRPDEASFTGGLPYLKADAARTRSFRESYRGEGKDVVVGLTWRSANVDIGDVKSLDVCELAPIFHVPGCRFVNLQYGDVTADLKALKDAGIVPPLTDPELDPVADFDGHMAQVAAMDLIISASNSTVHAAGALGIPTRVLLRLVPDRRWLIGREDTPWYSSVRLYRQESRKDWSAPIARAVEALHGIVAGGGASSG